MLLENKVELSCAMLYFRRVNLCYQTRQLRCVMNFQKLLEYKFFIDALPEIILIIKEGKIILANKKAEEVQTTRDL